MTSVHGQHHQRRLGMHLLRVFSSIDSSKTDILKFKEVIYSIFRALSSQPWLLPATKRSNFGGDDSLIDSHHTNFHGFNYTPDLTEILWVEIAFKNKIEKSTAQWILTSLTLHEIRVSTCLRPPYTVQLLTKQCPLDTGHLTSIYCQGSIRL